MGNHQVNDSYKWMVLVISFFMMMCFALSLQALPPLFEQMMEDVSFSNSQAGLLMGAYAIPGIFLPFIIAFLANRYDMKTLIIAALGVMIAGLVSFSFAGSFSSLVLYRLVAGAGATVIVVLSPVLITMYFDRRNMGIAMGIFNIAVPLGTVLAANFAGSLGRIVGWRVILSGIAGFIGVILLLAVFGLSLSKNEASVRSATSEKGVRHKFRGSLNLWLLAGIWVFANVQLLAYVTFGPQFYQSIGISGQRAGFLTSLVMLASIFLAPVIGVVFDKTGRKKPYLVLGIIIMLISFACIAANVPGLTLWAIALGIGFAPIPVFVFAHLPETVKPHEVGMGMGMLTVASNLGTTLGPSALGSILDKTGGNFAIAFIILAAVSIVVIVFTLGLKEATASEISYRRAG